MKISIIGLGWLGLPLAEALISEGYSIKGSTTNDKKLNTLKSKDIPSFKLILTEDHVTGDITKCLSDSDILILNTPPGLRRNPDSNYVAKIKKLIPHIEASSITKVIYISSTSVYADAFPFPTITSDTPPNSETNAGLQIREVETLLDTNTSFETSILRFSGLVADDRHPARMISKRSNIPNPKAPVNLIHRSDCISIIETIIQQEKWNITLNASYTEHPNKQEYYTKTCNKMGYNSPDFELNKISKGKLIDGSSIEDVLGYHYSHTI